MPNQIKQHIVQIRPDTIEAYRWDDIEYVPNKAAGDNWIATFGENDQCYRVIAVVSDPVNVTVKQVDKRVVSPVENTQEAKT